MVLKTIKTVDSDYFKSVSSHDSSRSEAGERAGIRGGRWGWGYSEKCWLEVCGPLPKTLISHSNVIFKRAVFTL